MPDYRVIPAIEQLRQHASVKELEARYGHALIVEALRAEASELRAGIASGARAAPPDAAGAAELLVHRVASRIASLADASLRRAINATGVVIHTNLGRAPLSARASAHAAEIASSYSNLEFDLQTGRRGARDTHAERLLCRLTGADAGVVVNNNAAATMLILAALANGREVLISRGELVEIGGGFRVPDVMAQSGAVLREVGTTNRTRASDYAAALGDRTGLILRVHPSNFRMTGFTERPSLEELVHLGARFGVPVAEDLGSGYLGAAAGLPPLGDEPDAPRSVAAGADVVCFSGDKLLGGPQAGLIVGRADAVARIRKHPLMRALRVDKMTYAALEATLQAYAEGRAASDVPVARMIALTREQIAERAARVAQSLRALGYAAALRDGVSTIGGGSVPGSELLTTLIAIARDGVDADALNASLRTSRPPVIARIQDGEVVLDLRTVMDDEELVRALSDG